MVKKCGIKKIKAGLKGSGGFSLVELIVVLSLLGLVLAGIYQFFFFGERSSLRVQAESEALQDARQALFMMEHEIRQAQRPSKLSGLPEGFTLPAGLKTSKAVVVSGSGHQMTVYSYIHEEPQCITYLIEKVDGTSYYQMKRSVDDVAELNPANWQTVVPRIAGASAGQKYFSADDTTITIRFFVPMEKAAQQSALEVKAVYAVRGKGAMQ